MLAQVEPPDGLYCDNLNQFFTVQQILEGVRRVLELPTCRTYEQIFIEAFCKYRKAEIELVRVQYELLIKTGYVPIEVASWFLHMKEEDRIAVYWHWY